MFYPPLGTVFRYANQSQTESDVGSVVRHLCGRQGKGADFTRGTIVDIAVATMAMPTVEYKALVAINATFKAQLVGSHL